MLEDDPLWYKDAIIYELHVKGFFDSNNDGIGDLRGLTRKLDYLQELGVNTLWLLPFYPSPMRDDGYDISDYHGIHPDYGTMADFRQFVREAHRRGLRVVTELVINHTSDQHPWFQAARRAPPGSAKRNYYVWSDTNKKFPETRIIFTDTERSNWAWDEVARAYYWHRFFSHQPDLNHNNPHVVKAVMRVMRFWFDAGVDGMRLDAVPYLCVREGTNNENLPETHRVLKYMRAELDRHYRNRMFLAEANQWPEDVHEYFGDGDECHMAYHFPLMPRIYMAIAQEDRHPIEEILQQTPDIPETCQWAIFLRNHDELTLEMVTDRERDFMYRMYAADPRARLNLGIRRRLAPLMENNRQKIELMNILLMTLPGSPIVYYGDEIGMGDNIYLGDRNGVRTPMQWSPDRNAGFSRADPQRLYLPPVMDPVYGFEAVNVEAQMRNPSSLLNWTRALITARKAHRAFGRGTLQFLRSANRKILAYLREYGEEIILCVVNLGHAPQPVELDLSRYRGRVPVELIGRTPFPPIGELPYLLTLPGYGFYGFRLAQDVEVPRWHEERPGLAELPLVVLTEGWRTFFEPEGGAKDMHRLLAQRTRQQLEREVLPQFLSQQHWFAVKKEAVERLELIAEREWTTDKGSWLLALVAARIAGEAPRLYSLPLAIEWGDREEDERLRALAPWTLARVRQKARVGILVDALAEEAFCLDLVRAIGQNLEVPLDAGRLRFSATSAFAGLTAEVPPGMSRPFVQHSNTGVVLGERLFLKGFRRLQTGVNPEWEMGRFLTETSPFPHVIPVAGAVEYRDEKDNPMLLVLLQGYLEHQGSGWSYTLDYLERFLGTCLAAGEPAVPSPHGGYLALMQALGLRTGQLHQALAKPTEDPAFGQEPPEPGDAGRWAGQVRDEAERTLAELERKRDGPPAVTKAAERLLALRAPLLERIDRAAAARPTAVKTRYHGNYNLGQVLLVQNDFVITDFEGEPDRPFAERRRKHSPLRDVAGMLRSLNHAASVALSRASAERPELRASLEPFARDWEREAREAFWAGCREGAAGCPSYPADPAEADALVDLFTLEKALYDLRREMDGPPESLLIRLEGLLGLLADERRKAP